MGDDAMEFGGPEQAAPEEQVFGMGTPQVADLTKEELASMLVGARAQVVGAQQALETTRAGNLVLVARFDAQVEHTRKEREATQDALSRLERESGVLSRTRSEFAQFKRAVRQKAIEVADQQNWCTDGLNEALVELGLDPKVIRYRVVGYVRYDPRRFVMEVEAQSVKDAVEQALLELQDDPESHEAFTDVLTFVQIQYESYDELS